MTSPSIDSASDSSDAPVWHLLRELAPQVLGAVARRHGDFAAAEDAVQEALIAAAAQWPAEGVPANPRGWLYHVALRRLTDYVRSEVARQRREETVAREVWADWAFVPPPTGEVETEQDDALVLLFMCCHPALTPPSAIALTLRAVERGAARARVSLVEHEVEHVPHRVRPRRAPRVGRRRERDP